MKKLLFALFAMAVVIGCSKNDNAPSPQEANGQASFLTVNFKSAGSITKAPEDMFEYGSTVENAVNNVVFYFFDENGDKYPVQDMQNFIAGNVEDWTASTDEPAVSIEKVSGLVLVIKQVQDGQIPAKMVAVLNAPASLQKSMSLAELQDEVLTALTIQDDQKNDYFIMSNSVYVNGSEVVYATEIDETNLFSANVEPGEPGYNKPGTILKPGEAGVPANITPVEIYVERVAAKVRVAGAANVSLDKIPVLDEQGNQLTVPVEGSDDEVNAYVKVLGWDVTNNTSEAYAIKKLSATYDDLGFTPWNSTDFHRSYWAETDAEPMHNLKFEDLIGRNLTPDFAYYFENTLPAAENNGVNINPNDTFEPSADNVNKASQLLVATQLVDEQGNVLAIGRWYGQNYTVPALKAAMVGTVDHRLYVKDPADATKFLAITADYVEFVQRPQTDADSRYLVYMTAKEGVTYYDATGAEITATSSEDETSAAYILEHVAPAQIWADGHAYYYTTIQHFGDATGIVRNHLYDIKIEKVTGFGTPVFEDGFVITPEKPEDIVAVNLSAKINILSWHVVEQSVIL